MTNKELHRKLWQWLADNPDKEKEDWPEWEFNGGDVENALNLCFACKESGWYCFYCPIKWNDDNECSDNFSEYTNWIRAIGKERSRLALVIKELWK